ncbi:MAG: cytidylate kinase family protein [Thermodesulfobacteriota bacterium]
MAILTISRQFGSGGSEIGRGVAEKLGYDYVHKGIILESMREEGNRWADWGKSLDEHSPSVWERYDWSFRGFAALLRSILLRYALQDNVVLEGRGGNFLLAEVPYAFRIRVIAPKDTRVERIMERESVDRETALWLAEKTERDRRDFLRALYGKDWNDPDAFDAVFSTDVQPVGDIVRILCDVLRARDEMKTPEAQERLRMRAAAASIEAGLITYPNLFLNTLEVVAENDGVVLKAVVRSPKQKSRVEDIARRLAGDIPLKYQLHYRAS